MTDFGRRIGLGDMLKSVYDPILAALVAALAAHSEDHEAAGDDEISVAGLLGTTPRALLADATPGRFFRQLLLEIADGTNDFTLKCQTYTRFNHTVITQVDNIAKGATTGGFTLSANGYEFVIENTILEGTVLLAMGSMYRNASQTDLTVGVRHQYNDIQLELGNTTLGNAIDITDLVDNGDIHITIIYITDA